MLSPKPETTALKRSLLVFLSLFPIIAFAQNSLSGKLISPDGEPVGFATVALYSHADSTLAKAETSMEDGSFALQNLAEGNYYLLARFLGFQDLQVENIALAGGRDETLGELTFASGAFELEEAVVVEKRNLIEVKADRTTFNVQGTINAAGSNGMELLRKAPGVVIDNNDNVTVLGRSGVLLYVDGKRVPLAGPELTAYIESLTADQIDRIDIITSPGAKYEAEGNAGVIDIRLKRDKNHGGNGTVSFTHGDGRDARTTFAPSGNYRNKKFNVFGQASAFTGAFTNLMKFQNTQFGNRLFEDHNHNYDSKIFNFRLGADYFLNDNHTVGFLATNFHRSNNDTESSITRIERTAEPNVTDSILVSDLFADFTIKNSTYNVNYVWSQDENQLNIDLDYGFYRNDDDSDQPNSYIDPDTEEVLSVANRAYQSPVDIDIYSIKADYEMAAFGGKLGFGSKLSRVETKNTFLFYDLPAGVRIQNDSKSNLFDYQENVYAGYLNYSRQLSEKVNINAGLRVEQTHAEGKLTAFLPELQEPPVDLNYTNYFPSLGISYQYAPMHAFALNYGKRINRPDYNVLNPFTLQNSELSYNRGNPFLNPEIVNNVGLNYTFAYKYNFSLSYSRTDNKITRLLGPDEENERASFISWDNLATETITSFNVSLPFQVTKFWSAFFNLRLAHKNNQASYDDGTTIDLQAWEYGYFQQHSFTLRKGFTAEVSSWYAGPGIWGGVFRFDSQYSIDLGLQKKFLNDQLNVKLTYSDLFEQAYWSGVSNFAGLESVGEGRWDSQRWNINLTYNFGNRNVKSRKRTTGLEAETKRASSDGGQ